MTSNFISIRSDVMHGEPCFNGTRVPVKSLFDYLKAGDSLTEFLDQFPSVTEQSAKGVLQESHTALLSA